MANRMGKSGNLVLLTQSCLTLWDPMACILPGSSVHGILKARILEWAAISFSRGSSWPRDWICVFCIAGKFFTIWVTREAPKVETVAVADFVFLGSKITADCECSHKFERHLLLGSKAMTNLDSILKSRDITLSTKVCPVKAMVFPGVMYRCESWTLKKAEHWRIDAFELWCWRRLLRVPWKISRLNESILKEISSQYSEGLMLKLKLWYFGYLIWTADSLEKTLMLGKIEGRRRRGWQRMRWFDGVTNSMAMNLGKLQEMVRDREVWHAAKSWRSHGVDFKCWTWLGNWTTTL